MTRLALAIAGVLAVVQTASAGSVGRERPLALAVSPARVALVAPASRTIQLRNLGAEAVDVAVVRKAVDRRQPAKKWLSVRPARVVLRSGSTAVLTLRVRRHAKAGPGDHQLRVLFVARPLARSRVAIRLRLGVGMRIRVPGRIVRRLEVHGLRLRRQGRARLLLVSLANLGNVTEQLRAHVSITLLRNGRMVSRLRSREHRELFPGARGVVRLRYAGGARGRVIAVVRVRPGGRLRPVERRYRLRL